MSDQTPQINVTTEGSVTIVELADEKILDEVFISRIGAQLTELVADAEKPKLVIDFSSVAHMSSSALGMLITLHNKHINEIFQIHPARQEALDSLA